MKADNIVELLSINQICPTKFHSIFESESLGVSLKLKKPFREKLYLLHSYMSQVMKFETYIS